MRELSLVTLPVALILCFTLAGCGGGNGTVPVEGTVQYQGQPVPGISSIMFQPEDGGRPSTASTGEDGHFVLNFSRTEKGAKPGKYAVTFALLDEPEDISPEIQAILEKHGPDGTPYEVEITGATTDLVINIE